MNGGRSPARRQGAGKAQHGGRLSEEQTQEDGQKGCRLEDGPVTDELAQVFCRVDLGSEVAAHTSVREDRLVQGGVAIAGLVQPDRFDLGNAALRGQEDQDEVFILVVRDAHDGLLRPVADDLDLDEILGLNVEVEGRADDPVAVADAGPLGVAAIVQVDLAQERADTEFRERGDCPVVEPGSVLVAACV